MLFGPVALSLDIEFFPTNQLLQSNTEKSKLKKRRIFILQRKRKKERKKKTEKEKRKREKRKERKKNLYKRWFNNRRGRWATCIFSTQQFPLFNEKTNESIELFFQNDCFLSFFSNKKKRKNKLDITWPLVIHLKHLFRERQ